MPQEEITLEGHIIDSLQLAEVLDGVIAFGGDFQMLEVHIGRRRDDRSHVRMEVSADTPELLSQLLQHLTKHGAFVVQQRDVTLIEADMSGAFPPDFYATTSQVTHVRYEGAWAEVTHQQMDCGIRFNPATYDFRCIPMSDVKQGDLIVCGHLGVKVSHAERDRSAGPSQTSGPVVSAEKPTANLIRQCARAMLRCRKEGKRIVLVGGPAIVHTGSSARVVQLIEKEFVQVVFAGNGLAAHDIENAMYGTSFGLPTGHVTVADTGHEHHLRATNAVRRVGGIRQAVEQGIVQSGIMHACVKHGVEYVLAGSIRDDGPLPDVITDVQAAQARMRVVIHSGDVGFVLILATGLHALATANMLPASMPAVAVDISPGLLTKLVDRGTHQSVGIVTDVAAFLEKLHHEIEGLDSGSVPISAN